jgi:hypothetical protein
MTGYRTSVAPRTLAVGAGLGVATALMVYALMPLGDLLHPPNPVLAAGYRAVLILAAPCALLAAGVLAGRRGTDHSAGLGRGGLAGLCAGGTAALLLNILVIATMLLLPGYVDLEWANPDPAVPHGTTFEVQMSVGDAAVKYQLGLLIGPLVGLALGAVGGISAARESTPAD